MRHTPRLRWAVALATAVLLAGSGCGQGGQAGDDAGDDEVPSTTAAAPVTSTTVRPVAYDRPGARRTIGSGFLAGASPDGSAVYVEQEDGAFPEPGCEGQPQPVLFRLPVDGGSRELLATRALPVRGQVVRGPGGRVAVVDACEGFLSRLVVGTETPDGHLRDPRQIPLPDDTGRPNPLSLSWSRDGRSLVAAQATGSAGPRIVRIDPGTGTVTPLFPVAGVGQVPLRVAELEGGTFAVAGGGRVELRTAGGERTSTADGNDFAVAPDGRSVVLFGRTLARLAPGGQGPVPIPGGVAGREITSAELSPDGRAVVYVSSADGGADNRVRVVTLSDGRVAEVSGSGQWGRAGFTGDGRAAVFNQFFPAPRFDADVVLVPFGP